MRLTKGERLFIDRRRRGALQEEEARRLGVSPTTYRNWENGVSAPPIEVPEVTNLRTWETCTVLRRRKSETQEETAQALGVSRYWLGRMELGEVECDKLLEYWNERQR